MKTTCLLTAALAAALTACKPTDGPEESTTAQVQTEPDKRPTVETIVLQRGNFAREILSNGTLASIRRADLRWGASGIIRHIYVKNGQHVSAGQVLAEVDKERLNMALMQAADSRQRAHLEMQDFLIGQGYRLADSLNVPEKTLELARMKSGYGQACIAYETARMALQEATLKAPFAGTVANLTARPHNQAGGGEVLCTLLDNSSMEVTFPVMEHEVRAISTGDTVQVTLYTDGDSTTPGHITAVNPMVADNGLAAVTAVMDHTPRQWFDGMKVRVSLRQSTPGMLVVPKEAVVMRDGRRVVFTVRNGLAYWNYVTLGQENSFSHTVSKGLKEGDSVIVSGNQNLAHFSPILIKP
ncbi:MAG: efflux RND transporter periplasmic adaptor subunit [Clostridium sp.]|nr:efflux RND transporter periplasmic adaptor subunit [Clostridium sp.]